MTEYRGYELAVPPTDAATDDSAYTMGLEFFVTQEAWVTKIWFWQPTGNNPSPSIRKGAIFSVDSSETGTLVSDTLTFAAPVSGWNSVEFDEPFELTINKRYKVCVLQPNGRYAATVNYFLSGDGSVNNVKGPLTIVNALAATGSNEQMSFTANAAMTYPTSEFNSAHYWVDVSVIDELPPIPGGALMSISDQARVNMLAELALTEPQALTNTDLMRRVIAKPGQTLVTVTSASAATHLLRYEMSLRS